MMKRIVALTAFGAGYVAGAAAGRERYEQIRAFALRVKDDPRVQEKAHQAADLAQQGAQVATERAKEHLPGTANGVQAEPTEFHATTQFGS